MNVFWVLSGFALLGAGCVMAPTVETTRLNAPPHPLVARPAQSVEIYSSAAPVRPHVDVALLRADQSNFGTTDTPRMVQSLAERAGQLGCDALFISGASERQGGTPGNVTYLLDPGSHGLLATCIAYLPHAPSTALAAPAPPAPTGNAIVLVTPAEQRPATKSIANDDKGFRSPR